MKYILILSITILGCSTPNIKNTGSTGITYGKDVMTIKNYEIDGCQYIGSLVGGYSDWCTHKGNCTNQIHYPTYIDAEYYE